MNRSPLPVERRPTGWAVLWGLTRGNRTRMGTLAAASFVGAMVEAGFLVLITGALVALAAGRRVIGPVLGYSIPLSTALVLAVAAVILRFVLNLSAVRVAADLGAFVRTEQRRRLSHAYLQAAWDVQQSEASGRLQELVTSFVGRVNVAMTAFTQGVTAGLSLVAFMAAGLVMEPAATAAVLGALGALAALLAPLRRVIRRRAGISAKADLAFANAVAELGSLGQEMQSFGVQGQFIHRIDGLIRSATEGQRRVQVLTGALSPTYTFFAYAATVAGVALLTQWEVGDLAAIGSVMLLMLRSLSYGQQLSSVLGVVASSIPSLEQLDSTVARYERSPAAAGVLAPTHLMPLTTQGVGFSYSQERVALQDLDLQIGEGQVLGIIGPSGAGKSTLAQLLLGLRTPQLGVIRAGGVQLAEVAREWWTRRVAFVPQEPLLFTGTVADNIRFFRPGLGEEALNRAAEQANVLKDIEALPDGFDTHLGERGSQLSGGQRQRVAIARALAGDPELLVLDEPTSALDGQSEALIRATLARLQGRVTIVIIAHRMSTLDLCDEIMVIEDGRVTARGTPQQLREGSEFFRRALSVAGMQ